MRALWVKDDSAQPHPLLQGPGGRVRAGGGPRARLHRAGLPVDRQPGQRDGRRGGARRHPLGRAGAGQPRAAEDRRDGGLRRDAGRGRGQLRRRQPGRLRAGRRARGLGVRERQRAALLLRGLQDARLRGGRGARLAAAVAGGDPRRIGLAADQGRQGVRRAGVARAGRGHAVQDLRGAGDGLLPGVGGVQGGVRRGAPGAAGHDRQVARDRQPGRRAVRAGHLPAYRRPVEDVTDEEIVEGIRLLARTEGIFAETAGGVDGGDAAQAARRPGSSTRTPTRSSSTPARASRPSTRSSSVVAARRATIPASAAAFEAAGLG